MDISTPFLILVPVTIGVVQAIKMAGLPSRFAFLTSLVIGVAGALWLIPGVPSEQVLQGLIVGLSASGLWAGTRATANI